METPVTSATAESSSSSGEYASPSTRTCGAAKQMSISVVLMPNPHDHPPASDQCTEHENSCGMCSPERRQEAHTLSPTLRLPEKMRVNASKPDASGFGNSLPTYATTGAASLHFAQLSMRMVPCTATQRWRGKVWLAPQTMAHRLHTQAGTRLEAAPGNASVGRILSMAKRKAQRGWRAPAGPCTAAAPCPPPRACCSARAAQASPSGRMLDRRSRCRRRSAAA
jgi:hypothetical protein